MKNKSQEKYDLDLSFQIESAISHIRENKRYHSKFLEEVSLRYFENCLKKKNLSYEVFCFHPLCEKKIIYYGMEPSFVSCLEITFSHPIRHQDILGCLFALGLSHDTFGDIFVETDRAYVVVFAHLVPFLFSHVTMIGKASVSLKKVDHMELSEEHAVFFQVVVPSFRIDVLVSKILSVSRGDALSFLLEHKVMVNYREVKSKSKVLSCGDTISVRGFGKFRMIQTVGTSKKGHYYVEMMKYQ